ncbi:MAG: hypothetical protein Q9194_005182 [Teloschistes cf. exilis]
MGRYVQAKLIPQYPEILRKILGARGIVGEELERLTKDCLRDISSEEGIYQNKNPTVGRPYPKPTCKQESLLGSSRETQYDAGAYVDLKASAKPSRRLIKPSKTETPVEEADETGTMSKLQDLKSIKDQHEGGKVLAELIEKDGAGAWPPKANHTSWPRALQPYKKIYLELNSMLPSANPSLDDGVNEERRNNYRSSMRKLFAERVNISQVESLLTATEAGDWDVPTPDAYNGFYCAVAVCRHAYSWATIPVVKIAQCEKVVDSPPELEAPWAYLQRNFGVTAESGNNTVNVLHNSDESGERIYKINVGLSDLVQDSEETFFRMFYDLEVLAFPIYLEMVRAIMSFQEGDKVETVRHLEAITFRLRHLLRIFYDNLTESRVAHSVWLSYVQGFQGWGVGKFINGEFVKYDGLSGNHVLFFQALDAFLGLDRYLTDENMDRYIPARQRELCLAMKKYGFRDQLKGAEDKGIGEEIKKIVNHMKVFRAAHRTRVMPYLEQPAPERMTMTAGKSVLEGPNTKDTKEALKVLDQMLLHRLQLTV